MSALSPPPSQPRSRLLPLCRTPAFCFSMFVPVAFVSFFSPSLSLFQTCLSAPFISNATSCLLLFLLSSFFQLHYVTNAFTFISSTISICPRSQNSGAPPSTTAKGNFSSRRLCWEKLFKMLGDTAGRWTIMVIII